MTVTPCRAHPVRIQGCRDAARAGYARRNQLRGDRGEFGHLLVGNRYTGFRAGMLGCRGDTVHRHDFRLACPPPKAPCQQAPPGATAIVSWLIFCATNAAHRPFHRSLREMSFASSPATDTSVIVFHVRGALKTKAPARKVRHRQPGRPGLDRGRWMALRRSVTMVRAAAPQTS
jgi:hypothetical protein